MYVNFKTVIASTQAGHATKKVTKVQLVQQDEMLVESELSEGSLHAEDIRIGLFHSLTTFLLVRLQFLLLEQIGSVLKHDLVHVV